MPVSKSALPPALPRRTPRAAEAAAFLRERLRSGCWSQLLPGEVDLARQLQVGRNTIRAALAQLEEEGWITTQMGCRRRVTSLVPTVTPSESAVSTAVLLLATPLHALAPTTLLWMDTLRQQLRGSGWHLETEVQPAAFKKNPAGILAALTAGHPSSVWILHRAPQATQAWFQARQIPAVVAGTRHEGLSLPQVDTDYRAVCRHAATRLASLGHRRLGLLTSRVQLAGDAESVAGFYEGAGGAEVELLSHNETPAGVAAVLKAAFASARTGPRMTALFSLRAEHHATAITWLLAHGVRIPGQLSLLCRDDEPFLQHLYPEPARYRRSAETFAKKLARLVIQCTQPGSAVRSVLLMPDFVRGESLARP